MPRGLTDDQKALLSQREKGLAYFFELMLTTPLRAWTGRGTVTVGGFNWVGVGEYGAVQGLDTSQQLTAKSISVALNDLPGAQITSGAVAATRAERYQGKGLNIYLGFCDTVTGAPLGDLTAVWSGWADVMSFELGENLTASLTGEHFTSRLRRANGLRMTSESHNQRIAYLGNAKDLFFEPQNRLMGKARPVLGS